MPEGQACDRETWSPQVHPASLQRLMDSLLTTLANIDSEHEYEVTKITRSAAQANLKAHLLGKLRQRHRERREPYVRQLALLRQRLHVQPGSTSFRGQQSLEDERA